MKNSAQRNPEQDDLVIVVSRENFHLEAVGKTGYMLLLNFTGSNTQHKRESCLQLSGAQGRASWLQRQSCGDLFLLFIVPTYF